MKKLYGIIVGCFHSMTECKLCRLRNWSESPKHLRNQLCSDKDILVRFAALSLKVQTTCCVVMEKAEHEIWRYFVIMARVNTVMSWSWGASLSSPFLSFSMSSFTLSRPHSLWEAGASQRAHLAGTGLALRWFSRFFRRRVTVFWLDRTGEHD